MAEKNNRWDIAWLIGHSAHGNATEWQKLKDSLHYMVSHMPIGKSAVQIALVTYTPESRIVWKLNNHNVTAFKQVLAQYSC